MHMNLKSGPIMEIEDVDFPLQGRFLTVFHYTQHYKSLFYETEITLHID